MMLQQQSAYSLTSGSTFSPPSQSKKLISEKGSSFQGDGQNNQCCCNRRQKAFERQYVLERIKGSPSMFNSQVPITLSDNPCVVVEFRSEEEVVQSLKKSVAVLTQTLLVEDKYRANCIQVQLGE